jgi:hypothetical protein
LDATKKPCAPRRVFIYVDNLYSASSRKNSKLLTSAEHIFFYIFSSACEIVVHIGGDHLEAILIKGEIGSSGYSEMIG